MLKPVVGTTALVMVLVAVLGAVGTGSGERERVEDARAQAGEVPGIPAVLLDAYRRAARGLEQRHPDCTGMSWAVLAGIGREESDHAAGHTIAPDGDTDPPVVGPRLDGTGAGGNRTAHTDSDKGRWDGDTEYDAAVGVTQLLPTWWAGHGVDGDGDGEADPHNVYDATASTAAELCTGHPLATVDFTHEEQLADALSRYNPWDTYVENVLANIAEYEEFDTAADGGHAVSGSGGEKGRTAAEWALEQVGKPYVWGGTGPEGFDCSGLVMKAWQAAGVRIPRVTTDQVDAGETVALDSLVPGDLLFYDTGSGPAPSHVTIYAGDGKMVNAARSGTDIRVEPVEGPYYSARFMSATRPG
ncbi:hypothetical protein GCM10009551_042960 [Nocardiopsis tropica]|uniref:C40 family peptidase n=1 Tax=Nocardiopsis tropica TaxID=109330 RepID=UPI0031D4E24C